MPISVCYQQKKKKKLFRLASIFCLGLLVVICNATYTCTPPTLSSHDIQKSNVRKWFILTSLVVKRLEFSRFRGNNHVFMSSITRTQIGYFKISNIALLLISISDWKIYKKLSKKIINQTKKSYNMKFNIGMVKAHFMKKTKSIVKILERND